ncbi:MAG: MFS transporter [Syntrophaceae bacterium]|nr:MFS transporter [Syntrophaceae bacterium]
MVLAGFLILMVSWGTQFSFSVFFAPLARDFGWDRASTSGVFSLSILLFGVGSIFAGRMADRWGPRHVVAAGGILMAGGLLLSSGTQSLWQLYLFYGVTIGLAVSAGWGPLAAAVPRWFPAQRGLAMGIMSIGISVGILVIPFLSSHLISAFGWRFSFAILGLITGTVIIGSVFLLKKGPTPSEETPGGKGLAPVSPLSPSTKDWSLTEALGARVFWVFFFGYLLWCTGFYMISVHLAVYGIDLGFSPAGAALAVSLIGGGSIFGKLFMGMLSDRIGPQKVMVINLVLQGLCIFGLILSRNPLPFYLFSALFGFGYGGTGPQIPLVVAQFFGLPSLGAILGVLILSGQIGGAIGPLLAGKIFDLSRSYLGGFFMGGTCVMVSSLLFFLLFFLLRTPAKISGGEKGPVFKSPGPG